MPFSQENVLSTRALLTLFIGQQEVLPSTTEQYQSVYGVLTAIGQNDLSVGYYGIDADTIFNASCMVTIMSPYFDDTLQLIHIATTNSEYFNSLFASGSIPFRVDSYINADGGSLVVYRIGRLAIVVGTRRCVITRERQIIEGILAVIGTTGQLHMPEFDNPQP